MRSDGTVHVSAQSAPGAQPSLAIPSTRALRRCRITVDTKVFAGNKILDGNTHPRATSSTTTTRRWAPRPSTLRDGFTSPTPMDRRGIARDYQGCRVGSPQSNGHGTGDRGARRNVPCAHARRLLGCGLSRPRRYRFGDYRTRGVTSQFGKCGRKIPYPTDTYTRTERVAAGELADAEAITRRLLRHFFDAVTGFGGFDPWG